MAVMLGIDTGGTYTDAVVLDDETQTIVAKAKALTTRPDLSLGIAESVDAVITQSGLVPADVALVSLSTTLATNALVEGQGGRAALILIGFNESDLAQTDLADALGDDSVIFVAGGHGHNGAEISPLDQGTVCAELESFSDDISGVAIASRFATRNPAHEIAARDSVREILNVPVTCSHELSQALGGPKRALTAVLNARLIGLIARLITATEQHLRHRGIDARLMVVRGDGALISAEMALQRPIETILSGPAASIAGAQWLTGEQTALVSDIGGTTTDVCLLRDGVPKIDPQGAKVGRYRTMVEAVAMRTFGLGGDSEVCVADGLESGVLLGPKRVMPVSLFALGHSELVHSTLDRMLSLGTPPAEATRFVIAQWTDHPTGLDPREMIVAERLTNGPRAWSEVVQTRVEEPALARLVQRGLVMMVGVTPSDASHVLMRMSEWDAEAANKALTLLARRRVGSGDRLAHDPNAVAQMIIDRLTQQTVWALLETGFAEEGRENPSDLARHILVSDGLRRHSDVIKMEAGLALPVIGLGASAASYYGAVGDVLRCPMILPEEGGVANAIGAVVGQVTVHAQGTITSAGEGAVRAHLPDGPVQFGDADEAINALRIALTGKATAEVQQAGVEDVRVSETLDLREAEIEGQKMFVEATLRITARGRPRIAKV